jgi:serine protease DegQ
MYKRIFFELPKYLMSFILSLIFLMQTAQAQWPGNTLAPLIEQASPAVVSIAVTGTVDEINPLANDPFFRRFMPPDQRREFNSAGSGVIVDAIQGHIITNHHVIANANEITVTLIDNRTLSAIVIGSDPGTDIAILKVEAEDLIAMPLGDSSQTRVGDFVVAIGNPFGLQHTVTSGIISALGRIGINPNGYEDFIQTDASINPGNSGGALVNLEGELIGINSAIYSQSGGNIGIGFAIPVNLANNIMSQIIENGSVRRGLLGVNIAEITDEIAESLQLDSTNGALITSIAPDSAAELAGLEVGDVVIRVNQQAINGSAELRNYIGMRRPDENVTIQVLRDSVNVTVNAILGELSTRTEEQGVILDELDPTLEGVTLETTRLENTDNEMALLVTNVDENSFAANKGLRSNDIITHINRVRVQSVNEFRDVLTNKPGSIVLQIVRDGRALLLVLK